MATIPAHDLSLRYPIGKFVKPLSVDESQRRTAIATLASLPTDLQAAVQGLNESQLDTPYREGGWTLRQLVHHVADSHMNAYVRTKLALTEEWPTISTYEEARWAEMADSQALPVAVSFALLDSLHRRWVLVLESLGDAEWKRGYMHPQMGRQALENVVLLYAWHSLHHTAHATELRTRMGW